MVYIYPATITKEGPKEYLVTFTDVPEAITSGATEAEALIEGKDALTQAFLFYLKDRRPVPPPSALNKGTHAIAPAPTVAMKAALMEAIQGVEYPAKALEDGLQIGKTEALRVLNPEHLTRPARMEQALGYFGRGMAISILPAAVGFQRTIAHAKAARAGETIKVPSSKLPRGRGTSAKVA